MEKHTTGIIIILPIDDNLRTYYVTRETIYHTIHRDVNILQFVY
jgi:hypothetical protein